MLSQGHMDYAARIVDGRLVSQIKDGTGASGTTWRSPSQVVVHLKPAAAITIPAGGQYDFLGSASSTVWQIPQTQNQNVIWAGWNTEELKTSQVTGPVTWKLTGVSGPGTMAIYQLDAFGKPTVIFNSKDGLPDSYDIPLGTHGHGNWAFTKQGAYRLTFTQSAKLASGTTSTDTQVLTVAVGDTDPAALLPKTTTAHRHRLRRRGRPVADHRHIAGRADLRRCGPARGRHLDGPGQQDASTPGSGRRRSDHQRLRPPRPRGINSAGTGSGWEYRTCPGTSRAD